MRLIKEKIDDDYGKIEVSNFGNKNALDQM